MTPPTLSRRSFVKAAAATSAGLTIAVHLDGCAPAAPREAAADAAFAPNPFIRIGTDDIVTVVSKHLEMGQGAYTGLATLVAEELDADWSRIRVVAAPADASRYGNATWGGAMGTGGSSSMLSSWMPYREAGAMARALLVATAAKRWGVAEGEIAIADGVVSHAASARSARFGELAADAATLPLPAKATPKDAAAWRFIGRETPPRVDIPEKVTGKAVFTQDVKRDGMLTALVAHPPRFGGTVKSFDATAARAVPGVTDVVQVPTGVAVVARDFWAARRGRDALQVEWDEAKAERRGSAQLWEEFRALAASPGLEAARVGDAAAALGGAARVVEATYEVPYLAHAAMEPMNCVVDLGGGRCRIWYGAQSQTWDWGSVTGRLYGGLSDRIGRRLGLGADRVELNMLFAGGSFGRRAARGTDYVLEGVEVAHAIKGRAPVKLVWTREDDTATGNYRPMFLHAVRGALDAAGTLVAWHHRAVGQAFWEAEPGKVDMVAVEGIADLLYDVPNLLVEAATPEVGVPTQWWRSVGHSHTAFAKECFVDELARAAGADPVAFRRTLLAKQPRLLAVLDLAAARAGWGTPTPPGIARGVAVHKSFDSYVAEVAEVAVGKNGAIKVERVVAAVDCGIAVNPDIIAAQVESAIALGLGAALDGAITLDGGVVQERNFDRYGTLRLPDMPRVEVHIVPSTEAPTGIGEPGLPPIAPAVANAIASLTGKPVRTLPLRA